MPFKTQQKQSRLGDTGIGLRAKEFNYIFTYLPNHVRIIKRVRSRRIRKTWTLRCWLVHPLKKIFFYEVSLGVKFLKTQSCGGHGVERMLSHSTGWHVQPAHVGLLLALKSWLFFNWENCLHSKLLVNCLLSPATLNPSRPSFLSSLFAR